MALIPAFAWSVTPTGAKLPVFDENDDGAPVEIGSRRITTETVSVV
ncbi:hypothetical protein N7E02_04000 (plasmid) [Aliirhizobium terrae]|nr:hypothetical protein [Rhizobium sp. CC-CFT758]WJH38578.1 hypothetical protein N7E02_04000 [Rhizobium sp. CC-CFT758]